MKSTSLKRNKSARRRAQCEKIRPPNIANMLSSMLKILVSENLFDRIRVVFYKIRYVSFYDNVFVSTLVILFHEK
jgi:hypothetical protein